MKEYGGYLEFEYFHGQEYHEGAYKFNTARHALRYVLKEKNIREIYLPEYLCPVIIEACMQEDVHIRYYTVGRDFSPSDRDLPREAWFYFINYYGKFDNEEIQSLRARHPHMIVDNVQAFFQKPLGGIDTIYTCRKFFGVSDGAYLYTDIPPDSYKTLPQDDSVYRIGYLAGRMEHGASAHYGDFRRISEELQNEPISRMSRFTENMMQGIDYVRIIEKRTENFAFLHEHLAEYNQVSLNCVKGGYMYPLKVCNGDDLRKHLLEEKIYIPVLWPNIMTHSDRQSDIHDFSYNILPLPIDQRYGPKDMEYIVDCVLKYLKQE